MRAFISIMCLVGLTSAFYPGDEKMQRLAAVDNDFTQKLHKILLFLDVNSLFSGFSIHSAWANMWLGSGGTTYDEIYDAFQLDRWTGGRNKPLEAYSNILQEYRSDNSTNGNVNFANYMSVNSGKPVIGAFNASTQSYFLCKVDYHSISDPLGPEKKINDYVKTMTKGFITEVFNKTGTINSTTQIVYVSALQLAALWDKPFDKSQTAKKSFYPTGSFISINIDMIQDYRNIKLKTIDGAKIAELPCLGDRYAVYFLLPNSRFSTTLSEQEQKLTNLDYIKTLFLNGFVLTLVHFTMPKIKMESTYELNSGLHTLGVVKSFDAAQANFGNFSRTSGAFVSKHIHKVVLDLNENGTAPIPAAPYQPTQTQFTLETFELIHPFLIFVRDKVWNVIILQGKFTGKSG